MTTRTISLSDKYTRDEGSIYLSGIQALVRIPIDQHRRDRSQGLNTATFISGYPGSPLAGLDHELHRQHSLLTASQIRFSPGLNEDLAATAVFGTQLTPALGKTRYDGVVGIWYGKTPGLDRSVDVFRHFNICGVDPCGGALALVGDDPGSKSSTLPGGSETTLCSLGMPTLYPGNTQEVLEMGLAGVALSRCTGLVVALKIVTSIADGSGTALLRPDRADWKVPDLSVGGQVFVNRPQTTLLPPFTLEQERNLHNVRLELAKRFAQVNPINRITQATPDAWLGLVAAGKTYYDLCQALDDLGLDQAALAHHGIRVLKIGMIFPLEREIIRQFADGLREILVIEEKREFMELFLKEMLYGRTDAPVILGKRDESDQPLLPTYGELDPELIARAIAARLGHLRIDSVERYSEQISALVDRSFALPMAARQPFFCSGCPHNRSTVVPEGSLAAGGIGCHGMVLSMDRGQDGIAQMGGEGAQWIGASHYVETPHLFQNIGDGTLFHSGMLAINAAVAAGVNMTYKILYNSAIAMTGGQSPAGALGVPALVQRLAAEGIGRIIITTEEPSKYRGVKLPSVAEVWHRDRIMEAQATLAALPGVTVLIHDQQCAADLRRLRKRSKVADPTTRVLINERVCEGCGDCGVKSNCLSVQPADTEFGRKTNIDQGSCNKDYSCLLGDCPSFLTVEPADGVTQPKATAPLPSLDRELPEPMLCVQADPFQLYMVGIGGTGVVTVNQVLATAATIAGLHCVGLDQTGLSQKAGPVLSSLKISAQPLTTSNRVMSGQADLLLGMDILTITDPRHLSRASADRTVAIVSTSQVPTGKMVSDARFRFPELGPMQVELERQTRKEHNHYLDANTLADRLFGDPMAANLILVGAAYQAGALPISAAAIEQAIDLNGVAVQMNRLAFRWGRLAIADPDALEAALHPQVVGPPVALSPEAAELLDQVQSTGELRRLLAIRIPDLIAYQDLNYARSYVEFVKSVHRTEAGPTAITENVARYLYKLMAYKDEYEVARLHLEDAAQATLQAQFGSHTKVYWHLHPPFMRALGMQKKLRLGRWFRPALVLLASLKRLRGTALDPFGYAGVRQVERHLVAEYRDWVIQALLHLRPQTYDQIVVLTALPDQVRGYEEIKLASVETYRTQAQKLLHEISTTAQGKDDKA